MATVNPVFANVGRECIRTFGVPAIYARGPDSVNVRGIFDRDYVSVVLSEMEIPIQSIDPAFFVMTEDLPGGEAKKGDKIEIDGEKFTVQEKQPDSEGGIVLMLRKG